MPSDRTGRWLTGGRTAVAAAVAAVPAMAAIGGAGSWPEPATAETPPALTDVQENALKGYDYKVSGLKPLYPAGYQCSPLTSFYASWIDVDGSRRDELHSGIDGGHLGDPVLAPAPATVRRVWVADWGQGREGALLLVHTREDLGLATGPALYYAEIDHLRYEEISGFKVGQRIARGERIATVFRPGGKREFLPEVHLEVFEVGDDDVLTWRTGEYGTEYFENPTAHLIDPLYMLSLEVRPTRQLEAPIQPFDPQQDYSAFKGYTYHLPCRKVTADAPALRARSGNRPATGAPTPPRLP
jgi:hypothetical protein